MHMRQRHTNKQGHHTGGSTSIQLCLITFTVKKQQMYLFGVETTEQMLLNAGTIPIDSQPMISLMMLLCAFIQSCCEVHA